MTLKETLKSQQRQITALFAEIESLRIAISNRQETGEQFNGWEISGDEPELKFTETDKTDPAGRYALQGTAASWGIKAAILANWADFEWMLLFNDLNNYTLLRTRDADWYIILQATGADGGKGSSINIGSADSVSSGLRFKTGDGISSQPVRLTITLGTQTASAVWSAIEHTGFVARGFQLGTQTPLIISGGVVNTISRSNHRIDTQGEIPSDDLDTIDTSGGLGSSDRGRALLLQAQHTDRTIVVKHGTGNIQLADLTDISLDSTDKMLLLFWAGSNWVDIGGGTGKSSPASVDNRILSLMGV